MLAFAVLAGWESPAKASGTVTNASLVALQSALAGGGPVILAYNGTIITPGILEISFDTMLFATTNGAVISGGNGTQVFYVDAGVNFTVTNLTITGGNSTGTDGSNGTTGSSGGSTGKSGGSGSIGGNGLGGAIYNQGNTTLINCNLLTNSAAGGAGGSGGNGGSGSSFGGNGGNGGNGGSGFGGAIYNLGSILLSNCTVAGNSASGGIGG
ncbi:MAG TPA: hypothetical protein VFC07_12310, partial [Verrucomicrobiae bacterium]|nr:hypothetical protein [Verrucomicrobiae bacterium]